MIIYSIYKACLHGTSTVFYDLFFFSIQEKLSWKTGEGGPFKMLYKQQWARQQ